jgi:hypothetical protein
MNTNDSPTRIDEIPPGEIEALETNRDQKRNGPEVTFMGNTYDLTALGALVSALLLVFICFSCNIGIYCLPFIPLLLGLIGVFTARQAVDRQRTAVMSWIGIGAGALTLLMIFVGVVLYFGLIFGMLTLGEGWYY